MAGGGRLSRFLACCGAPGVHAVVVLRFGQWLIGKPWPLQIFLLPIYYVLSFMMRVVWGIDIPRSTRIGPGFYIGHYGGIFISSAVRIGGRFTVSQQVVIGLAGHGENRGCPTIGNNVYIAPGAKLYGKITIGDNVKIGPNAVVNQDLPDNAIAVLDPGFKIVSFKGNPIED